MSVALSGEVIHLSGAGRIEDAEALVTLLQAGPTSEVDLTQAGPLHAAIVQALLAFRPTIVGPAGDPFVQAWLMPLLTGHTPQPKIVTGASSVAEPSATDETSVPSPPIIGAQMPITVLIVDDSKLARIVAAKAISNLQPEWSRREATNAEEALAAIGTGTIDVALLDYNMPGRNGLELAAAIRELYPSMPLAVITANVQHEVVLSARGVGAAFVTKPLTEEGLRGFLSGAALRLRSAG